MFAAGAGKRRMRCDQISHAVKKFMDFSRFEALLSDCIIRLGHFNESIVVMLVRRLDVGCARGEVAPRYLSLPCNAVIMIIIPFSRTVTCVERASFLSCYRREITLSYQESIHYHNTILYLL